MTARRDAADVAIVGGGVVGCASAYFLARAGVRVCLLERASIASEASGAAAGMLAPLAEAESEGPFLRAATESLARFEALSADLHERTGIDPEYRESGIVRVARSEAECASLRRALAQGHALGAEWLDPAELGAAVPGVMEGLRGGLWSPREAHVRSPLLVRAYARAAEQLGATIETGVPVHALRRDGDRITGVETADGPRHAGQVLLCAGAFAPGALGDEPALASLPIRPVRGQLVIVEAPAPGFAPILWGPDGLYLVPKADGTLVVGATTEDVGFDCRVTAGALRDLLARAAALLPAVAHATFRAAFAGLRPGTADQLPLIGPVPGLPGLAIAAGHYRNGVLLSPLTGAWVADGLTGKGWAEPAFLPERGQPGAGR